MPQEAKDFSMYRIVSNENPLSYHFMPTYLYDTRDQVLEWTSCKDAKDADAAEKPKSSRKGSTMKMVPKYVYIALSKRFTKKRKG